ncbi:DUF2947 family protein [Chryseobacterium luquanense]|uniref:DUF2947 domain-containing protein n=1 Tax=Chryseobacterium luquanense TaxID=2983766 RepID=A0ABT3Y838_9FLAO|nr:DUF2947 family protein [Chryseobacterium luquanense]MCX8534327.1 DUF2947 domain-containing protein [Chryseobacterium luquanense]
MTTLNELKLTTVGWRFTDQKSNKIDEEDLKDIKINDPEYSKLKWTEFTHSQEFHLFKLNNDFWRSLNKVNQINVDWGSENKEELNIISKECNLEFDDRIIFFWGGQTSFEISWYLFIKYWDDFCYPSDDNNLIICEEKKILITYVEDCFTIYYLQ